jgi:hypothetical protein
MTINSFDPSPIKRMQLHLPKDSKMNILHLVAVTAVLASTSGMNISVDQGINLVSSYFNTLCPNQTSAIEELGVCVNSMDFSDIPSLCAG